MTKKALTETLQALKEETHGDHISIGDIVESLNNRGFGTLLIAPALIIVMPTGIIPGVPTVCALLIILVAAQIVMGRHYPWIPKALKEKSFDRKKYKDAVKKCRPITLWVDGFFHERLTFLTKESAQRVIALLCVILALCIIPLELVPFAASLPGLTILIFGLSLSVRDGLLASIGFFVMTITCFVIPYLWLTS